jgi:putative glutamine amidotransferase
MDKKMKEKITIGITDCGSYTNYEKWFLGEKNVNVIRLGHKFNNVDETKRCDGVVLSGGEDVHPRFYNKPEYLTYCDDIDEQRDEFELKVLEITQQNHLPVLGICRGLQVANVYFGGTLIPDIPSFGKYNHSRFPDDDRYHRIDVDAQSLLCKITGYADGIINSSHHQSCEMVAKGLVVNSFSPDGVVEGMERRNIENQAYLMLVQWHPERMRDLMNPFSIKLKESFLEASRQQ